MADTNTTDRHSRALIDDIEPTTDKLTGRAGLSLFTRYLRGIEIFSHLDRLFGSLRQSGKGQPIPEIFKQLFCFFLDGTSRHLVYFDALKQDEGYAGAIETGSKALLSSHAVKRFFGGFYMYRIGLFRRLLQQLFLWRRRLEPPPLILLGLDTMVMDNDEAEKRHGAAPTYKRVKGFQPLQVTWDRYVIDAVFRGGDKHSNHSDTAPKTLRHLIQKIRRHYREDVPIIVRADSGFFDQKLMADLEALGVGYLVAGKLYDDLQALSPGSGNRPGGPIKTGIKSGGTWSWGTGGATGRSFGGRCFASRFMRIGNVCWSLPARIRSCTPIWVVVLGWTSSCGPRGWSVGWRPRPCWKATMGGEPTSWCIGP